MTPPPPPHDMIHLQSIKRGSSAPHGGQNWISYTQSIKGPAGNNKTLIWTKTAAKNQEQLAQELKTKTVKKRGKHHLTWGHFSEAPADLPLNTVEAKSRRTRHPETHKGYCRWHVLPNILPSALKMWKQALGWCCFGCSFLQKTLWLHGQHAKKIKIKKQEHKREQTHHLKNLESSGIKRFSHMEKNHDNQKHQIQQEEGRSRKVTETSQHSSTCYCCENNPLYQRVRGQVGGGKGGSKADSNATGIQDEPKKKNRRKQGKKE